MGSRLEDLVCCNRSNSKDVSSITYLPPTPKSRIKKSNILKARFVFFYRCGNIFIFHSFVECTLSVYFLFTLTQKRKVWHCLVSEQLTVPQMSVHMNRVEDPSSSLVTNNLWYNILKSRVTMSDYPNSKCCRFHIFKEDSPSPDQIFSCCLLKSVPYNVNIYISEKNFFHCSSFQVTLYWDHEIFSNIWVWL